MKIKTSVALEDALLSRIDQTLERGESRSTFIEQAARNLLERRERSRRDERDIAILNANADALNAEALANFEFVNDLFEAHQIERP